MLKPNNYLERIIPYKPGKSLEEVQKKLKLKKVIKLASNENPFGPSPKALELIKKYLNSIHRYPDSNCLKLREKLSINLKTDLEEIIVGNGSDEILDLVFKAYIKEKDEILTCSPTFQYYKISAYQTPGDFREIPLKDYTFDCDSLLNSIKENTKIIIICNPNNPTGTYIPYDSLKEFIKNLPENVLLIIDEAYFEFYEKDKTVNSIDFVKIFPEKSILVLRTFSKIYGLASLRIGYGIGKKEIINNLNKVRQPFNVNGIAQIAAIGALEDKDFLELTYNNNLENKKILYNFFKELNIFYLPTQTNFIFFDPGVDNNKIFNELLKYGVIIRSLKSFGYKTALRISIGTKEEIELFMEKFKIIIDSFF